MSGRIGLGLAALALAVLGASGPAVRSGLVTYTVGILMSSIKILREYERAVVFFLGRFQRVMGPGLIVVLPVIQQLVRVDLRTRVFDVPPQDVITRDNVSVKVNAVVYLRVVDPQLAIIQVANFSEATSQLSQTTLRAILGKHELDALLAEREKLNSDIQATLDQQTDAWGIKVSAVEIKHVDLNETMRGGLGRLRAGETQQACRAGRALRGRIDHDAPGLVARQQCAQRVARGADRDFLDRAGRRVENEIGDPSQARALGRDHFHADDFTEGQGAGFVEVAIQTLCARLRDDGERGKEQSTAPHGAPRQCKLRACPTPVAEKTQVASAWRRPRSTSMPARSARPTTK